MQVHELKILPQYFEEVINENKTFEVRKNDRNYRVGDYLHLREWRYGNYTGRETMVKVTYLLDDPNYCKEGFVILGIHRS